MKKRLLAALAILAAGCASTGDDGTLVGRVRFINTNGQPHGDASLFSVAEGVRIVANVPGVTWAKHVPLCEEDRTKILGGNAKRLLKL